MPQQLNLRRVHTKYGSDAKQASVVQDGRLYTADGKEIVHGRLIHYHEKTGKPSEMPDHLAKQIIDATYIPPEYMYLTQPMQVESPDISQSEGPDFDADLTFDFGEPDAPLDLEEESFSIPTRRGINVIKSVA